MDRRHTDKEYEAELDGLREHVLLMGARVEEMLEASMRAFEERDLDRAQRIIESDARIDQLEIEIDERCLLLLARRQPVASDLRFITTSLKAVTDLERIGDLCVNLCERVLELKAFPKSDSYPLDKIHEATHRMLRDSLDALVARDASKARGVMGKDRTVDALYAQMFPQLVSRMMDDPDAVFVSTRLLSVGRYLERIADHATNLAEMVIFMVEGEDVRHPRVTGEGDEGSEPEKDNQ